jgi:hypothetical protein
MWLGLFLSNLLGYISELYGDFYFYLLFFFLFTVYIIHSLHLQALIRQSTPWWRALSRVGWERLEELLEKKQTGDARGRSSNRPLVFSDRARRIEAV